MLLLGLASAGGAGLFVHFCLHLPMGEGPAGPEVSAPPFQSAWSERPVVLLGIGDSITAGFGAPPEKAFMTLLASSSDNDFAAMRDCCLKRVFPNLRIMNIAVSGSDSIQHLKKQLPSLKPFDPDVLGVVVLTTGGNDLIHWYGTRPPVEGAMYGATLEQARPWIAAYAKRLEEILNGIMGLFPGGSHIFIGNIYDPTDGQGKPFFTGLPPWPDGLDILAEYNQVIQAAAQEHDTVDLVDIHDLFTGHGITCRQFWRSTYDGSDPHYWYFDNIEDPNERGHDALRRAFLLEMAQVLANSGAQRDE